MSKKKIISVISMLLSAALISISFMSCAKSGNEGSESPVEALIIEKNSGETTEESAGFTDPDLPVVDYEGYTFRMLNIDQNSMWWSIVDANPEEEIAEPVNDAMYSRNRNIEEKYNIIIKEVKQSAAQVTSTLRKNAKAGSDEYDAAFPITNNLPSIVGDGALVDLYEVPYLDFDQPWWNTSVRQYFSLNKKLYAMTSDFLLTDNENVVIMMYNKTIAEELALESAEQLYDLVDEGKWTFSKFAELCKAAVLDLNGDGKMKGGDDRFGITTVSWMYQAFMVGFGETVTGKDENDLPFISCKTERYTQAYDTMVSFMLQRDTVVREGVDLSGRTEEVYVNDRALFCGQVLSCVRLYKNMGSDFGLLPMPKLDENQDLYYTPVLWSSCITIPSTNPNLERTGLILEALTAESRKLVIPAYYEVAIGAKYLRDDGSFHMLDVILSNQTYDIANNIYSWGSFSSNFDSAATKGSASFASLIEKYEAKILSDIEKTLQKYQ